MASSHSDGIGNEEHKEQLDQKFSSATGGTRQGNRTIYIYNNGTNETKQQIETFTQAIQPRTKNVSAICQHFKGALLPHVGALQNGNREEMQGRCCLDVGCGPGRFTVEHLLPSLPASIEKIVAVDSRDETLRFARANNAHSKIEYRSLSIESDEDVTRFVKEHGRFPLVTSIGMLHWIKDQHHTMRNIANLVAPNGECFIVFGRTLLVFEICKYLKQSPRWQKYFEKLESLIPPTQEMNCLALRSYARSLVREAGLNALACEVFDTSADVVQSTEDLTDFYMVLNPFSRMISEDEKAELRKFTYTFIDELKKTSDPRLNRQHVVVIHACNVEK